MWRLWKFLPPSYNCVDETDNRAITRLWEKHFVDPWGRPAGWIWQIAPCIKGKMWRSPNDSFPAASLVLLSGRWTFKNSNPSTSPGNQCQAPGILFPTPGFWPHPTKTVYLACHQNYTFQSIVPPNLMRFLRNFPQIRRSHPVHEFFLKKDCVYLTQFQIISLHLSNEVSFNRFPGRQTF